MFPSDFGINIKIFQQTIKFKFHPLPLPDPPWILVNAVPGHFAFLSLCSILNPPASASSWGPHGIAKIDLHISGVNYLPETTLLQTHVPPSPLPPDNP